MTTGGNPYANILGIATAIVSTMTWRETLNVVAEKIGQTLFAHSASINSFDPERRTITYEGYWCVDGATQEDLDYIGHVSFLDDRPDFKPLVEEQLIVEAHVDDASLDPTERDVMKKWGIKTTLDGPLVYDGGTIGTVGVAETRFIRRFTPSEIDLFTQLCELASIGVSSAQTARTREAGQRRMAALEALSGRLPLVDDRDEALDLVIEAARTAFEPTSVTVDDSAGDVTELAVQRLDDTGLDSRVRAVMEDGGIAVRLVVPIVFAGGAHAPLVCGWSDEHHRVSDEELRVARILAGQAALSIR